MDTRRFLEWQQMSSELKELKKNEMALRKELCNEYFKGSKVPQKAKFSQDGYDIELENKSNTSLDKELVSQMYDELSREEKSCLKFNPTLVAKEYKALCKVDPNSLLHEAVTVKPAAPTMKVKISKKAKSAKNNLPW